MEEEGGIPYTPQQATHAASIEKLTNPEAEIRRFELELKGRYEDSDGKIKTCGKRLLNDNGVNAVIGQVRSVVNQSTALANLKQKMMYPIVLDQITYPLVKDLLEMGKYEIKDPVDRDKILTKSQNFVWMFMTRAREGDDKRFWSRILQEFKMSSSGGEKSGFFSKLNPFKS